MDFNKIDIDRISTKLSVTPKTSFDPIFGSKPLESRRWSSFPKWHGNLITKSLLEFIRATSDWDGKKEFKFLPKKKYRTMFLDNLVFSKSLNIIIAIECKRNLDQQDDGAITRIKEYREMVKKYQQNLILECKLKKNAKVFFCVFDAYGPRKKIFDFPIIYTEDLKDIFGSCVSDVWKGFEKTFYEKVNDLNFNIDENYSSRVQGCNNLLEMKEMSIMKKDQNCVYELSKIISILTRNNKKDKFK